jgi:signal transduction histidine kinase
MEQQTLADQLKKLLISTENPVIAIDRKLRLIFANPSAEKLFGIRRLDTGTSILNLISAAILPADYRTVLKELRQNRVYIYEIALAEKIFFCHIAGLGDKRIEGWVAVLNDVTELKELDRIKSEMVRMTSHDLKNPLQVAMANLDNLRDDVTDNNGEGVLLAASKIEKSLIRMNRIIGGILDLERARMSVTRLDLCNPADIIAAAIDEVQDIAIEKGVELWVDLGTETSDFRGDAGQFGRAMVNLIENAIKFTPAGGSVWVSAYHENACVMITVSDTGIGIPPEIQPHIFDRFFRGQQPGAEHISGSGLGLSLVKAVVESHRGQIRVESELGKGTTFFLSLPAAP